MRTLLHITDLHLAEQFADSYKGSAPVDSFRDRADVALASALDAAFSLECPSAVLVGGDLTSRGEPEGFERFRSKWDTLRAGAFRKTEIVAVVPGNHDVLWDWPGEEFGDLTRLKKDGQYYTLKFRSFLKCATSFADTWALMPESTSTESSLKFDSTGSPVRVSSDGQLTVLCINSAIRCGEISEASARDLSRILAHDPTARDRAWEGSDHQSVIKQFRQEVERLLRNDVAQITQAQLEALKCHIEKLPRGKVHDGLRIALVHHHLLPIWDAQTEHKAYENMVDTHRLLGFLIEHGFQVVLCGHKHQSYETVFDVPGKGSILVIGTAAASGPSAKFRTMGYEWNVDFKRWELSSRLHSVDSPNRGENECRFLVYRIPTNDKPSRRRTVVTDVRNHAFGCAATCEHAWNFRMNDSGTVVDGESQRSRVGPARKGRGVKLTVLVPIDGVDHGDYDEAARKLRVGLLDSSYGREWSKRNRETRQKAPKAFHTESVWEVYGQHDFFVLACIELKGTLSRMTESEEENLRGILASVSASIGLKAERPIAVRVHAGTRASMPASRRQISALVRISYTNQPIGSLFRQIRPLMTRFEPWAWYRLFEEVPAGSTSTAWVEIVCSCGSQEKLSAAISQIESLRPTGITTFIVKPPYRPDEAGP